MKKSNYIIGLLLVLMLLIAGCGDKEAEPVEADEDLEAIPAEEIVELEEGDVTAPEAVPEEETEEIPAENETTEEPEEEESEIEDVTETDEEDTAENYRVISLKDLNVYPEELTIKVGTTVEWRNVNDKFNHIIGWAHQKSDWGVTPEPILAGESWSYTFEKPGEIQWFSTARPTIQGTITVEE